MRQLITLSAPAIAEGFTQREPWEFDWPTAARSEPMKPHKKIIQFGDVTGNTFWDVLNVTDRVDAANRVTYCFLRERAPLNGRRPMLMDCWVPHEVLYRMEHFMRLAERAATQEA